LIGEKSPYTHHQVNERYRLDFNIDATVTTVTASF
jgi:hypothetical protein